MFIIRILVVCFFSLLSYSELYAQKETSSKRTYRRFVLENELKVLLVSDPELNVSSAALDISVGSLADPKDRQGLAHFVEHMLFLATEKYPELNAYGEYLKSHGGYSNAFTAADHTNYHFEVNHEGLPEALDRFAQFFIGPLLLQEYAEREIYAVNSEHQKNIPQDSWRLTQLRRSLYHPEHPANAFHTGNLETLKNVTKEQLHQFIQDNYTPERMALCIVSNRSLDDLERMARSTFSAVPKNPVKPLHISEQVLHSKDCLRLLRVVPVKDIRELRLYFAVPSQQKHFRDKTGRLLGMTMGDEGKGSLLSLLKEENLASSLSAGLGEETRFYSALNVSIELTEKGLAQYEQVLAYVFSYIAMLRETEFPRHIWEEIKTSSKLSELYSPKQEGSDLAISLSSNTNQYGLELAETVDYLYESPDVENYAHILKALRPENALVFLVAKDLTTNLVEPYYQTAYAFEENKGALYKSLKEAKPHPKLHLPLPNLFMPKDISVLPEQPILLVKNAGTTLWYGQDTEFSHPKVSLFFHILSPVAYRSARHAVLTELYTKVIQEQLNEFAYPALVAGLAYSLSTTKEGVLLQVSGYSESAFKLLNVVSKELKSISLSEAQFQAIYQKHLMELKNTPFAESTTISREVSRQLNLKTYFDAEEQLKRAENLTLDDVKQYLNSFYERNHIEAFCYGNLTATQAKNAVEQIHQTLESKSCSPKSVHQEEILWLQAGQDFTYKQVLPTNNSCLRIEYTVGIDDLKTQAAMLIMSQAIRNSFYTEMRTKQMLGYVVFSGAYVRGNFLNLYFIIQSGDYPAQELFKRADQYLNEIQLVFPQLLEPQFKALQTSLIESLSKKPNSIHEKAQNFYGLAFEYDGDFLYTQKKIEALRNITPEEVSELFQKTLGAKTRRRLTMLLNAAQHPPEETPATIQNISEFHQNCIFDKK